MFINDPIDIWGKEHTIGNAELAARLGSVVTFDRRGTIFWHDDFGVSPLKWYTSFSVLHGGSGHSITLSDEMVSRGVGCMKMIPPSANEDYAYAYRYLGGAAQNRIGVEATIRTETANALRIILHTRCYTGTRLVQGGVRITKNIGLTQSQLSYRNTTALAPYTDSCWTDFKRIYPGNNITMPLKYVLDITNEKYNRCMFAGEEIDMSEYVPRTGDYTANQYIETEIYVVNTEASNAKVYIDDFIMTIEEPE